MVSVLKLQIESFPLNWSADPLKARSSNYSTSVVERSGHHRTLRFEQFIAPIIKMSSNRIENLDPKASFLVSTLDYSLKPLAIWLKLIGVPIETAAASVSCMKKLYSTIFLLLNLSIQCWAQVLFIKLNFEMFQNQNSFPMAVNSLFGILNFSIYVTSSHIILLNLIYTTYWNQLSNLFSAVEKNLKETLCFSQRCRKECSYFLFYILFSVS